MKQFKIQIEYFKPSGKYYTGDEFIGDFEACRHDDSVCYMQSVVDWVRGRQERGEPLPGLSGPGRDFIIRINCDAGHPVLIHPNPSPAPNDGGNVAGPMQESRRQWRNNGANK